MLLYKHDDDYFSRLESRLLISCPREGSGQAGFYELDLATNSYRHLADCDGRGLVRWNDHYLGASRNDGIYHFDANLNIVDRHPIPYVDLHGLEIGPDGLLYAVETAHNRIGVYRMDPFERIDEITVSPAPNDHNHVNDIQIRDGRLLVSMFAYHGSWRTNWDNNRFDGAVVEFDLAAKASKRLLAGSLRMPHTVRLFGDDLCFCESFNLNVVKNGEILAQFSGYTRGLAYDGRCYFIGQSRMRHWGKHLEPHLSVDAGIHILDSQNRVSRFVPLPSKQVYDIVIVN